MGFDSARDLTTFSSRRDREIARFRRRLGAILALRHCLRLFFVWIMVWATTAVVLRAIWLVDPSILLWGLLGFVPATVAAIFLARRHTPPARAVRAALDRHGRLGGLLMAAGDQEIGRWRERISSVPLPALRWRSRRQWMMLLASIGFLAAAFLAPDRYLSAEAEALQVGGEMQKLTEKVQVLKQEQIVPPEKAQVLEKDLDRVRQEALGKDPAKTMEAIDHLENSFSKWADHAAESALKETEAANRAQELAQALADAQGKIDPAQFSEAMKELAQMAQDAAAESKSLSDALSGDLADACQKGDFTPEQLQALRNALGNCKACQRAMIAKLVRVKLVDGGKLKLCDKCCEGQCDEAELVAALCDCKDRGQLATALTMAGKGGPGGGGPPAVMTWSEGTKQEGAAFKEKVLPPAAVSSLKDSRLAGISVGDPTSKEPGGGSASSALGAAQAGGGAAHTQLILPEHEKTVQRYFDREKKK